MHSSPSSRFEQAMVFQEVQTPVVFEYKQDFGMLVENRLGKVNKELAEANKILGYIKKSTMFIPNLEVSCTLYI